MSMHKRLSTMTRGATAKRGIRSLGSGMVCGITALNISHEIWKLIWCGHSGIPKVMASSKTLATEIISNTDTQLAFKMKQEYTPRVVHFTKPVNSLVTLTLDEQGKVKYHKDMWNEKDYSHEGLGKIMKTLNGDQLTKITRPPDSL